MTENHKEIYNKDFQLWPTTSAGSIMQKWWDAEN